MQALSVNPRGLTIRIPLQKPSLVEGGGFMNHVLCCLLDPKTLPKQTKPRLGSSGQRLELEFRASVL